MRKVLVALISDTHMPKRARRLPERCVELLGGADAIVHAGDVSTVSVLREIEALGPPVHAVHGNVDEPELVDALPASLQLGLGPGTLAVIHDAGPARGRLERLRAQFPEASAVVFGHSHLPLHEGDPDFQIFNPGSPTERRRAPRRSMGLLRVEPDGMAFEHVWLGAD